MNEILWQTKVRADILSPDFTEQLGLENAELPSTEQPFYMNLDVTISLATSAMAGKIESYRCRQLCNQRITERKAKYSAILGEQINEVFRRLRESGYALKNAKICAEPTEDPQEVTIALLKGEDKEYDQKGREKKVFTVISVIPSGPGMRANLERALAEFCLRKMKEELHQPEAPLKLSADRIAVEKLLRPIAQEIAVDEKAEASLQTIIDSLKNSYHIHKIQPFSMGGRRNQAKAAAARTEEVPSLSWVLYMEKNNAEWSLTEMKSGMEAQYELERLWKRKTTRRAIVLHDLKPVPYTLLGKQEHGFMKIVKSDAAAYPALRVVWDQEIV